MNLCRSCGEDFGSAKAFDAHRVGVHVYTYSEGAAMDPVRDDGRRCLSAEEMEAGDAFVRNALGRWSLAAHLAAARVVRDRKAEAHSGISEAAS
jgi:hypothetical protein